MQTKKHNLIKSITNVTAGYLIAVARRIIFNRKKIIPIKKINLDPNETSFTSIIAKSNNKKDKD